MKATLILSFIFAAFIFSGCASNGENDTTSKEATATSSESSTTAKTAYDGATGSGLLMERYKAGSIEGYRD